MGIHGALMHFYRVVASNLVFLYSIFMKLIIFLSLIFSNIALAKVDKIVVFKEEREMFLMEKGKIVKQYTIRLSLANNNPKFVPGPKRLRGDHQTPVGRYKISKKRRNTNYRKSLYINYPNKADIIMGKKNGYSKKQLGDNILIHGERVTPAPEVVSFAAKFGISRETVDHWAKNYFYPFFDWTDGCIAVNEFEMDEIFDLVSKNTPIHIYTSKKLGMQKSFKRY